MRTAEIRSSEQEKLNRIANIKWRLNDLVLADTNAELVIEEEKARGEKVKERGYNDKPKKEIRKYIKELIKVEQELGIKDDYILELRRKYLSFISKVTHPLK
ncbi:MAG TPA: hypothetical protein VMZ91_15495 [Candidatus Paceibacterota bacterium]|nr:hypothetical protein [Candidatus Paceibacterota bacterium]